MPSVTNVSGQARELIHGTGWVTVDAGEALHVAEEELASFVHQVGVWELSKPTAKKAAPSPAADTQVKE